ncbi:MAG TPA: FlgD immunoglobulin-like domain containing protein [Candidatus Dormibacteraeota bacterium]|nr:FlgD immunoglobulin-like domain containing protein [Candidatus Dormibacteraeota bacterium]
MDPDELSPDPLELAQLRGELSRGADGLRLSPTARQRILAAARAERPPRRAWWRRWVPPAAGGWRGLAAAGGLAALLAAALLTQAPQPRQALALPNAVPPGSAAPSQHAPVFGAIPGPGTTTVQATCPSGLTITLSASPAHLRLAAGQTATVRLQVDQETGCQATGAPTARVHTPAGTTGALTVAELAPGTYAVRWTGRTALGTALPPGAYTISVQLAAAPGTLRLAVPVSVVGSG